MVCVSRKESKWYIFSRFREMAMRVGTQFVVIIRLHGTGRVEDVISEMGSSLLYTAACDIGLGMLFQRTIYLDTFIFNTSANGGW